MSKYTPPPPPGTVHALIGGLYMYVLAYKHLINRNRTEVQHTYLDPHDVQTVGATGINQEEQQMSMLSSSEKTIPDKDQNPPVSATPFYEECDDNHDELGNMAPIQSNTSTSSTGHMAIVTSDKAVRPKRGNICWIEHVELNCTSRL